MCICLCLMLLERPDSKPQLLPTGSQMSSYNKTEWWCFSPNDCLFSFVDPLRPGESFRSPGSDSVGQTQPKLASQASLSLEGRAFVRLLWFSKWLLHDGGFYPEEGFNLMEVMLRLRCLFRLWPSPLLDLLRLRTEVWTCIFCHLLVYCTTNWCCHSAFWICLFKSIIRLRVLLLGWQILRSTLWSLIAFIFTLIDFFTHTLT